jgi:NADH:ubiquinone oxidoreductase subunit 4 (subunit M)
MAPLLALMVYMGVYPKPFLNTSEASVNAIQERVVHQAGGTVEHAQK